jgi:hypothetical protein
MASSVAELLQPQFILRVVSRIRDGSGPLGRWLGFQTSGFSENDGRPNRPNGGPTGATEHMGMPPGDNKVRGDVRVVSYRIFDVTRVIAKGRAPGNGPAVVARNPIGQVQVTCPRFHEKIPINYEFLGNLSPVVGPNSQVDPGGEDYLMKQFKHLGTQFNKAIEAMSAGMMRDSLYFVNVGDDWYVSFTAPGVGNTLWPTNALYFQVSFQVPATNKGQGAQQLGTNPTGGALIDQSWLNTGTLIYNHIMNGKAAFAQLSGYPVTDMWINSTLLPYILQNTQLRNLAGSSYQPFSSYTESPEIGLGGENLNNHYKMKLTAEPTITWHITDDVLVNGQSDVDPTYGTAPSGAALVKLIPDTMCIFCNGDVRSWTQLYEGSEYVIENPGMPGVKRSGMYTWKEYTTQPANIDLIGLMNCVPMLFIPKILAPLTVIY